MPVSTNYDDPRSTAAAAIAMARELAPVIRGQLPGLLGQRSPGGLAIIADRMEERLFERFTIGSLEGLLDQCEREVAAGTHRRVEWVVVRDIGGDEELEPIQLAERTEHARQTEQIAVRIHRLLGLVARTEALLAADQLVAGRR